MDGRRVVHLAVSFAAAALAAGIMVRFQLRVRKKLRQNASVLPASKFTNCAKASCRQAADQVPAANGTDVDWPGVTFLSPSDEGKSVSFPDADGVALRGVLLLPNTLPAPALVM